MFFILLLFTSCGVISPILESEGVVVKECSDHDHIKYQKVNGKGSRTIRQSLNQASEKGDTIYCDIKLIDNK